MNKGQFDGFIALFNSIFNKIITIKNIIMDQFVLGCFLVVIPPLPAGALCNCLATPSSMRNRSSASAWVTDFPSGVARKFSTLLRLNLYDFLNFSQMISKKPFLVGFCLGVAQQHCLVHCSGPLFHGWSYSRSG